MFEIFLAENSSCVRKIFRYENFPNYSTHSDYICVYMFVLSADSAVLSGSQKAQCFLEICAKCVCTL